MKNLRPLRKIAVGVLAAGVYFGMHKLNAGFTDADANSAAQGLVGFLVAWAVPDPRVIRIERKGLSLLQKFRLLDTLTEAYVTPVVTPVLPVPVVPVEQPPVQAPVA